MSSELGPADARVAAKPTVYDVAAASGVSIATVSRVLRRPDEVLEGTREKVLRAVRELGYVPSAAARGLADRRTGIIGLLLPGREDEPDAPDPLVDEPQTRVLDDRMEEGGRAALPLHFFMDEVVRGAEGEAGRRGLGLLVAAGRLDQRDELVESMAGRVDGLVVVSDAVPTDLLRRVARRVPVVLAAGDDDDPAFDTVTVANREGMSALLSHVITGRRPRHIVYLAGEDSPDERGRDAAFADAIAGASPRPEVERWAGDFSEQAGRDLGDDLASRAARGERLPDLVVCASDQMALGVLEGLAVAGISVPGTVAVTGFDGIPAGRFSTPRLTTVQQPRSDLGRIGVRMIVERLQDPGGSPKSTVLPVRVLLRESCPPDSR